MTLEDYLRILRRHWLGVLALTVLGVLVAAVVTLTMPRVYQADASGFVTAKSDGNPGMASVVDSYSKSRAKSYVELAKNRAVADRVIEELGLRTTSQALVGHISASVPLDTVTLKVTAQSSTPQGAQDLANAWIKALSDQIAELENSSTVVTDAEGNTSTGEGIVSLVPQDTAVLPSSPVSPNARLNLGIGLVLGLALGVLYAMVRNIMDKRIRSAETVEKEFEVPVIGTLPIDERLRKSDGRLIGTTSASANNPHLRLAEALRELRTNIQFINVDEPPKIMVMTSPLPQDGKSTVAANLALAIAETGRRVILIDADLRRPTVAGTFSLPGKVGLTDVIAGKVSVANVLHRSALSPQLYVLSAGTIPPNPSELLGSQTMFDLVHQLAEHAVVILDAPPLLPVTDSAILSARTDGAIVTISAGKTQIDELRKALSNITKVNGKVLGVIINRVPIRGADKGQYGYYADEYVSAADAHQPDGPADDLSDRLASADR
ncbi:MAG: polysaccharide biosynthesis tyrosine autokinase [Leucobacter sp.]